jgi:hypothetical protein
MTTISFFSRISFASLRLGGHCFFLPFLPGEYKKMRRQSEGNAEDIKCRPRADAVIDSDFDDQAEVSTCA